ncbi:molybdopterin cofactor-binding domain-containing protein [Balneola sp. MJW-20]|uniref:xanthine dehydrogenase family protein molybdopterin-binding subunit n=1 Tax=Gracilimonas aurantiaca TaxID=3234185 RepID=UPI003465B9F7
MTKVKTHLDRRSFLKVSAAGGAGFMLSFSWLGSLAKAAGIGELPENIDLNAYIKISDTGEITLFSPNPEIGQNVKTSMPLIVAEELDIDWDQVMVEQAPLDTSKYRRQIAGGSQSIRQGWNSLRMAGATARMMLVMAAANRWGVATDKVTTSKGVLTNTINGNTLSYGEVATEAASIDIPDEVELKDPSEFKLIGKHIKNVDGFNIVTGKPLFGIDFKREGMVTAMIIHPPAFGMKLKSFDGTEAKKMPGVSDVFSISTSLDEPQWSDINAFNDLVVITGESTWQVMQAKEKVKAEWQPDGSLESTEGHKQKLRDSLMNDPGEVARQDGDPDSAASKAARTIESTFTAPFLAHNTLEPMNFFADVRENSAELVGPIQTPESLRASAAALLGLPIENVTVDMTRMGGGFGRRLYGNFGLEAAVISQKIGKPVKLLYKREDDMTQGTYRPAYAVKYKAALDENGDLLSFQAKGTGLPSSPLFANRFPAGTVDHYMVRNSNIPTDISTGAWRAPRSNFTAGAEQAFIDEVAEAAGKDPIEFRLELFDRAIKDPVGQNNDYDPERYAGVLKLVREKSGWNKPMPGVYRGVAAYYCHNSYVAQVVDLVMEGETPRIKKVWCAIDCGIVVNKEGALNQVEGGTIDGIGHCMYSRLTFDQGAPQQNNFDGYQLIRNDQAPDEIEVFFAENEINPTGLGEPALPPISGALANALYKATGKRYYNQPFMMADQEMMS